MTHIQADYLVVGAGAVGMAFVDTILTESEKTIAIVDDRAKPGGHWNDAYPFVTLHQPSLMYGVASVPLSSGRIERVGLNAGLHELASGDRVLAYYGEVMKHHFLPTGRVTYLPASQYLGNGRVRRNSDGAEFQIDATKEVDATYFGTNVPLTHTPNFSWDDAVTVIPPNALPRTVQAVHDYVILGGGKTAIDSILFLLEMGVPPEHIRWVRPRESWMLNRGLTQPGLEFFDATFGAQADIMEACAVASDPEDLFDRLEGCGWFLRIDKDSRPTMFHGATVSVAEVEALRQIDGVIRAGHVHHIAPDRITLANGEAQTSVETVHVDCTACAVTFNPVVPVFQDSRIVLQLIRMVQPVFSASVIAHVDLAYDTDKEKNALTQVVPFSKPHTGWIQQQLSQMANQYLWTKDKDLRRWMAQNPLNAFVKLAASLDPDDAPRLAILERMRSNTRDATMNLMRLRQMVDAI